ncbi:MAG: helix-hairpin-helix domain-containing protein [Bacteroidia bacterium]|nr:helix-hairpin-helix domain-containing protein [Bacteroidia bacterium]
MSQLRKSLTFSASQRRGVLLLFVIIGLTAAGVYLVRMDEARELPPAFPALTDSMSGSTGHSTASFQEKNTPQALDINQADSARWEQMPGIGPVLAARIVKYRDAIGGFEQVADLQKVYGLPAETYDKLLPYLRISPYAGVQAAAPAPVAAAPLDLNKATADELASLPGIGPVLSARIVKYRDAIGGFTSVDQLQKVYQLSPETYTAVSPMVFVAAPPPPDLIAEAAPVASPEQRTRSITAPAAAGQRADLNVADSAALTAVPGIGPVLAARIVKYRKIIGGFVHKDQLRQVYGMSAENYDRMAPFLDISPTTIPRKDLNRVSEKTLAYYLSADEAKNLIGQRTRLGRFESWEEIQEVSGLPADRINFMKQYFTL